jgi:hypothetical protein
MEANCPECGKRVKTTHLVFQNQLAYYCEECFYKTEHSITGVAFIQGDQVKFI